jgi:TolA-binding protein
MNLQGFVAFGLTLTFGFFQLFTILQDHYSGFDEVRSELARLKEVHENDQLKLALAKHEQEKFHQHLATLLPDKIHDIRTPYAVRQIASLVQVQEPLQFDTSERIFERGKNAFSEKKYEMAKREFSDLIEKFPSSPHLIEAYFLLAESAYLIGNSGDCLEAIDVMLTLFPESELTGFALLRMGRMMEERHLAKDAEQIYRTVVQNYSYHHGLTRQAKILLSELRL